MSELKFDPTLSPEVEVGDLKSIFINGVEYDATDDVKDAIKDILSFNMDRADYIESAISEGVFNQVLCVLFAVKNYDEAWDAMIAHKELVDINLVFSKEYFSWKKESYEFYKYLFDNGVIDEVNYRYFEVLSGKLNDIEYWRQTFKGKTVSEKLTILNDSFNGVNPFDPNVGLIAPTSEALAIIFEGLVADELLDEFVIGSKPSILIPGFLLQSLIESHNFKEENIPKIMNIIFQMDPVGFDWKNMIETLGKERIDNIFIDEEPFINISTINGLKGFLNNEFVLDAIENKTDRTLIFNILVNSDIIITHPNTINDMLSKLLPDSSVKLSCLKYKFRLLPAIEKLTAIDSSMCEYFMSMHYGYMCAVDIVNNRAYVNGLEFTTQEFMNDKRFDFVDKYINDGLRDEGEYSKYDDDTYCEICHTINQLKQSIHEYNTCTKCENCCTSSLEKDCLDEKNDYEAFSKGE